MREKLLQFIKNLPLWLFQRRVNVVAKNQRRAMMNVKGKGAGILRHRKDSETETKT